MIGLRLGIACALFSSGCMALPGPVEPEPLGPRSASVELELERTGTEIMICGTRFDIQAPVVLWNDPGGYDGYDNFIRAGTNPTYVNEENGARYLPGRKEQISRGVAAVSTAARSPLELGQAVDQFVLHYDVCGTSRQCFEVLHHLRGLSVHFMLDIDGTLYQTMDLQDTAWHATKANSRSIGVEIASIGARLPSKVAELDDWYAQDGGGVHLTLPARYGDGGVRSADFLGRPASPGLIEGRINGSRLLQYDFTDEQYQTLAALLAVLTRELPGLPLEFPRTATGEVVRDVLADAVFESFSGILGHYHVQLNKTDPGPAFDWRRLERDILGHN
jgi:N-acetylmuramoyl-L-alanine amidase